jgi:NADH-quinone oxidoreductase subunit M
VNKTVAVIATAGIILAAAYVLWMVQRTTQGTLNPALEKSERMRRDLNAREIVVVAPLIALVLFLGYYPKPVLDVINPAVQATFSDIGKTDPHPTVATNPTVAQGGGK